MFVPFMPPHMSAKPVAKKPNMPKAYTAKFIENVSAAFFARIRPVSTRAKPACMKMTKKPAINTHMKLIEKKLREEDCATASSAAASSLVVAFSGSSFVYPAIEAAVGVV